MEITNLYAANVTVGLKPASTTLILGQSQAFTAVVANTSDQMVTWELPDASSGSITADGVYTAPTSLLTEGKRLLAKLAATHGTKPSTVQSRARVGRWVRGATANKRQIIADAQAGVLPGMKPDVAEKAQEKAITEDLEDMQISLTGHRRAIRLMQQALDQLPVTDPLVDKKAKVMVETIENASDGIRKIRGLDDPNKKLSEDELNAIVAEITGDLEGPHAGSEAASR